MGEGPAAGALLFVQFALSHFVEIKRYEDLKNPGSQVCFVPG